MSGEELRGLAFQFLVLLLAVNLPAYGWISYSAVRREQVYAHAALHSTCAATIQMPYYFPFIDDVKFVINTYSRKNLTQPKTLDAKTPRQNLEGEP